MFNSPPFAPIADNLIRLQRARPSGDACARAAKKAKTIANNNGAPFFSPFLIRTPAVVDVTRVVSRAKNI